MMTESVVRRVLKKSSALFLLMPLTGCGSDGSNGSSNSPADGGATTGGGATSGWATSSTGGQGSCTAGTWLEIGSLEAPESARKVMVSDDIAFVVDNDAGLVIANVADPTRPTLLDRIMTDGHTYDAAVSESLLATAEHAAGFRLFDISDPTDPIEVGALTDLAFSDAVAFDSNHLFVGGPQIGLRVFDVTTPAAPIEIEHLPDVIAPVDMVIEEGILHVLNGDGLRSFDIADPTAIVELSLQPLMGPSHTITFSAYGTADGRAYVSGAESGMAIVDVSDPTSPSLLGSYDTVTVALSVAVSAGFAYLHDGAYGVRVLDVTDPSNITRVGTIDWLYGATGLKVVEDLMYVADAGQGLRILRRCTD